MKTLPIKYIALFIILIICGCCKDHGDVLPSLDLEGNPGNPRFNLQFDNEVNVDLDLYVRTPLGDVIYYANAFSSNSLGELDVDCLCNSCPNGPNENIFFPLDGSSPKGTYEYWVEYFKHCNEADAPSNYKVYVLRVNAIIKTHEGTLTSGKSDTWTYVHN